MPSHLVLTAIRAMKEANPKAFMEMWAKGQVMPAAKQICDQAREDHGLIPVEMTADWKMREEMAAEQVRVAAMELVSEADPETTGLLQER